MEATCIMKKIAIILAAGKNTRIKGICYDRPKCLLSVCGQPLINRIINQFMDYVDEFYIAAGSNSAKIASVIPQLSNIHIWDFCGEDLYGNGITLQNSIHKIKYSDSSIIVLESDIVLSDLTVKKFISDSHPIKFLSVEKEINAHDDAIIQTETGYQFTKQRKPEWKILGKFIGVSELTSDIIDKIASDTEVPEHYAEFIARYSTPTFHLIKVPIEDAMEIDNEQDYSFVLNNYNIRPTLEQFEPYQLHVNQGMQTFVGVYDVIGSKIARQYGIDGLYLGSYQISASLGKKDNEEFTLLDSLSIAEKIRQANINMPIILDGMSGFDDNTPNIDIICQKIIEYKISAICIDDVKDTHKCSMNHDFRPELLSIKDFISRISYSKKHLGKVCKIIARTEIMNITQDIPFIQNRINKMHDINADILLPHYVGNDFHFLKQTIKGISVNIPMMIIPSGLLETSKREWSNLGFQLVIYANLDMRLRINELEQIYEKISTANNINETISDIHKLKDVYEFG